MATQELTEAQAEWYDWRDRIGATFAGNGIDSLALLEQTMIRSLKERRCSECGEPGTIRHKSGLIKSVNHYFLCDDCDAYFEGSVGCNRYTVLRLSDGEWERVHSFNNKRKATWCATNTAKAVDGETRVRVNA